MSDAKADFFLAARPRRFAHRGGSALWPENTLLAFDQAVDLGFSYLETDVHLSRDGELVVFHDSRLERTTNGHGAVSDHTLAELKQLDAAYHFSHDGSSHPHRGQGLQIPTLAELLDRHPDCNFNVELKAAGTPQAIWELIQARGVQRRLLVAAARDPLMRQFRRLSAGQVATSASLREAVLFLAAVATHSTALLHPAFDALQVPIRDHGIPIVTPAFVAAAHGLGIEVHVWTIDDIATMKRLLALKVDGIMTDRPDRLAAL